MLLPVPHLLPAPWHRLRYLQLLHLRHHLQHLQLACLFSRLSGYLFNARSIVNKICELHYLLYNNNVDICFITESWLHDGIHTGLLDPESRFTVLRKDRNQSVLSDGGGVCVLIKKCLRVIPVSIGEEFADVEVICFDLVTCDR